jgi:hypothetical protein
METSELLRFVAGTLEKLGIRYFVTGSMATIFFGEPRFTNDIGDWAEGPALLQGREMAGVPPISPDMPAGRQRSQGQRRSDELEMIQARSERFLEFRGVPRCFVSPESRALQASQAVPAIPASRDNTSRSG